AVNCSRSNIFTPFLRRRADRGRTVSVADNSADLSRPSVARIALLPRQLREPVLRSGRMLSLIIGAPGCPPRRDGIGEIVQRAHGCLPIDAAVGNTLPIA